MNQASVQRIGFIGGGNMSRSIAGGLVNVGWPPDQISISEPDAQKRLNLSNTLALETLDSNVEVLRRSNIVVLGVKPQVLKQVCTELAGAIQSTPALLISIAAGVRIASIIEWLQGYDQVIRVMPNTPALVGSGASALFGHPSTSDAQRDSAESVMRAVGTTVWVEKEYLLDTVTALSGSGPAYFLYIMSAMQQKAIELGLDEKDARLLTLETALGTAKLALESSESFEQLRLHVTSPGGTTEKAIEVFEQQKLQEIIAQGIDQARRRSEELASFLGDN